MAYFPNGTSGMDYEARYCASCIHGNDDGGCPIWSLHLLYNYDQCNNGTTGKALRVVLGTLIPETEDGLGAKQCNMFRPRADVDADESDQRRLAEQPAKYEAALAEMRGVLRIRSAGTTPESRT